MSTLIIASTKDTAGMNIARKLVEKEGFTETGKDYREQQILKSKSVLLTYIDEETIHSTQPEISLPFDDVIFASKHKSDSGRPNLTVHVTGNLEDDYSHDGEPKSLAWASPQKIKSVLASLQKSKLDQNLVYSVSLEATHHGPTSFDVPVTFVEVGGSERQWLDDVACEVAADAVWVAATQESVSRSAVGFGGGHYASKLTRYTLGSDVAVGHIMPKYAMKELNVGVVKMMIGKTRGGCDLAVLEKKGIHGEDRRKLVKILKDLDLETIQI